MNSRERVLRILRHETADRVPLTGGFCPQVWAKLGEHFRTKSHEQVRVELGIDLRRGISRPPLSFQKQNCVWFEED